MRESRIPAVWIIQTRAAGRTIERFPGSIIMNRSPTAAFISSASKATLLARQENTLPGEAESFSSRARLRRDFGKAD